MRRCLTFGHKTLNIQFPVVRKIPDLKTRLNTLRGSDICFSAVNRPIL